MFGSTKRLEKRLESLEENLARLERSLQSLDLEWMNAYAKFKKIAGRIAKDQAVIDSRQADTSEEGAASSSTQPSGNGGLLTQHQKAIQQAILQRRAGRA